MSLITYPNRQHLARTERATAMVFEDAKSKQLLERIGQIAPSDASVLIIGNTGTGKELVARQVHQMSQRRDAPFVAVNCGAFTESLAESELFGHEKGAFTGAIQSKVGWFEAANNGTLFLDEVGDLSPSMQVKLLRVLQEREIVRVGSLKPIKLNVRVIAATNVHLEEAVQAGKFREDLYYRLNVALLKVLPLAERKGDILPLAHYFIGQYCHRLGYPVAALSSSAIQKLLGYSYPGNIRELENAIHHALLVCKNHQIQPDDFCFSTLSSYAPIRQTVETEAPTFTQYEQRPKQMLQQALLNLFESPHALLQDNLDQFIEETTIRMAYEYCHYNQVQTAKLLGVSRNIVRARLVKYGLLGNDKSTTTLLAELLD